MGDLRVQPRSGTSEDQENLDMNAAGPKVRHRPSVPMALAASLGAALAVAPITAVGPGSPSPAFAAQTPAAAPQTPPIVVCGNASLLTGPTVAPSGSVTVAPSQNLPGVVSANPANTTFWLSPGTYAFGSNKFDQVIPLRGDTFIGAPGAIIDGQHRNLYAFTQHATGVTIEYLTIQNFGAAGDNNNEGVVNHDSGTGWLIEHDTIRNNAGAGVMLGSHDVLSENCLTNNGQYGFSAYSPGVVRDLTVTSNEISHNDTYDWGVVDPGCGCSGGAKFWNTDGATVTGNYVHDNKSVGLWADTNNVAFNISYNYISGNANEGLIYEISYNASISDNTFVRNALRKGPTNPDFPTGAIYISESGSDARVAGPYSNKFSITGNLFEDNWSGVILWENADRFCGSPDNTSTRSCTLTKPSVANISTCNLTNLHHSSSASSSVYYQLCRWRTQNVVVSDNTFKFNPSDIGADCTVSHGCGFNGIFSEYGSDPSWSPYHGTTIEKAITTHQDNHFSDNTYIGPWRFKVYDQAGTVSFGVWKGHWSQDSGSIYSPSNESGSG
jgi:hypothetical protein